MKVSKESIKYIQKCRLFAAKLMDKNSQMIQYQQILFRMQDNPWRRSVKVHEQKINGAWLDTIKNTLLDYRFNSQFYVNVPNQVNLPIILFLVLYNESVINSKKIKSFFDKITIKEELQQLNDHYFTTFDPNQKQLDIPSRLEKVSEKFSYHQKLIIKYAAVFDPTILNSILEHEFYKNKLQVREFIDENLVPFNKIAFTNKGLAIRNDIVLIPYQGGTYIASYSTKPQNVVRDSTIVKQAASMSSKNEIKAAQIYQQYKPLSKSSQVESQSFKQQEKSKYDEVLGSEKEEMITFIALLIVLIWTCTQAYTAIYN